MFHFGHYRIEIVKVNYALRYAICQLIGLFKTEQINVCKPVLFSDLYPIKYEKPRTIFA